MLRRADCQFSAHVLTYNLAKKEAADALQTPCTQQPTDSLGFVFSKSNSSPARNNNRAQPHHSPHSVYPNK